MTRSDQGPKVSPKAGTFPIRIDIYCDYGPSGCLRHVEPFQRLPRNGPITSKNEENATANHFMHLSSNCEGKVIS